MYAFDAGDEPEDRGMPLGYEPSEAERVLAKLSALRRAVLEAWSERAVILTREEQARLREEIRDTCDLLSDLTEKP